jgi:hypothetical protein
MMLIKIMGENKPAGRELGVEGGLTASKQALSIKTWAGVQAVGSSARCFKQIWKVGKVGKVGMVGKVDWEGLIMPTRNQL